MHNLYKLLIFTCYGGYSPGVAASKACIRIWEENPDDVKIGFRRESLQSYSK
jgi:hypothetical protein